MSEDAADTDTYALKSDELAEIPAPDLPYRPPMPTDYRPGIGLIGTGGISASHLDAYKNAGWNVAALWNRTRDKAQQKADEYFPDARIEDNWQTLLDDPTIEVIDITLPTEHRAEYIEASLKAGKHVLSQKPFVADLDRGRELVDLAEDRNLHLAVNQNGRWAPHLSWMRQAVHTGLIGELISTHISIHWDHGWTAGTPFDEIEDLILYDFGIHWFDFLSSLVGDRAQSVIASVAKARGQANKAPLLAQAMVRLDDGQASLVFDGGTPFGSRDTTYVAGTSGSLIANGPDLGKQQVQLITEEGIASPILEGQWFNDGFQGAMGELLCAIEENREPLNSARNNLKSLALTFAAVHSSRTGQEVEIGTVRNLS